MLIIASLFAFASCNSDDEPDYSLIVGTWSRIAETHFIENKKVEAVQTLVFNSDKTAKVIVSLYVDDNFIKDDELNCTYTYNGETLKLKSEYSDTPEVWNMRIAGDKLTIIDDDGPITFTRK